MLEVQVELAIPGSPLLAEPTAATQSLEVSPQLVVVQEDSDLGVQVVTEPLLALVDLCLEHAVDQEVAVHTTSPELQTLRAFKPKLLVPLL